jgi:hypothetical protein
MLNYTVTNIHYAKLYTLLHYYVLLRLIDAYILNEELSGEVVTHVDGNRTGAFLLLAVPTVTCTAPTYSST